MPKHSLLRAGFALALLNFADPVLSLKLQEENDIEYCTFTDEAGVDFTGEKVDLVKFIETGTPAQVLLYSDEEPTIEFTASSGALEARENDIYSSEVEEDPQIIKIDDNDEDGDEQTVLKNDSEFGTGIAPDDISYDLSHTRVLFISSDKQPVMKEYYLADEPEIDDAQIMTVVENLVQTSVSQIGAAMTSTLPDDSLVLPDQQEEVFLQSLDEPSPIQNNNDDQNSQTVTTDSNEDPTSENTLTNGERASSSSSDPAPAVDDQPEGQDDVSGNDQSGGVPIDSDQNAEVQNQVVPSSNPTLIESVVVDRPAIIGDEAKGSEARGLTHWILASDGEAVFAYSLIQKSDAATKVLSGLSGVNSLTVDPNQGYLFVASASGSTSTVDRYEFTVDISKAAPVLAVKETTKEQIYEGSVIESIAIDADQGILYIADSGNKRIDSLKYDPSKTKSSGSTTSKATTLYEKTQNLDVVTSVEVDYQGNLFWAVREDGKDDGAIIRGQADTPDSTTTQAVTKSIDAAFYLRYQSEFLFYAGADTSMALVDENQENIEESAQRPALYYKNMPKSGEITTRAKMISNQFEEIVGIGTFNTQFIYVADAVKGFFAIESFKDDEFSDPRQINITGDGQSGTLLMPTAMVVFTLDAIMNFSLSLTAGLVILSVILF